VPSPEPSVIVQTACEDWVDINLGEANVEWPEQMNPGSNQLVTMTVHIPPMLASINPRLIKRVEFPEDDPPLRGELGSYKESIYLAREMRVELQSLTFESYPLRPALQRVDIDQINKPTTWVWDIKAPDDEAIHNFQLLAYRGDEGGSCWIRTFPVDVSGTPESQGLSPLAVTLLAVVLLGNGVLGTGLAYVLRKKPQPVFRRKHGYNLRALRGLLLAAFGPDELLRLCQEDPQLRPILDNLDANPSLNEIVDKTIIYCERHELFDELLANVRERNATQYARFEPHLRQSKEQRHKGDPQGRSQR
jgi:hypothetical protein